ncbi:hypothetical protein FRC08_011048 [Ceratobasidium sp. 394]|nr:hypothetical protein FRC08_011048 [Ceratobasidium sp. 394]
MDQPPNESSSRNPGRPSLSPPPAAKRSKQDHTAEPVLTDLELQCFNNLFQGLASAEPLSLSNLQDVGNAMYNVDNAALSAFSTGDANNLASSLIYGNFPNAPTTFPYSSATFSYHTGASGSPGAIEPHQYAANVQPVVAPPAQYPAAHSAQGPIVPPTKQVPKPRSSLRRSIAHPAAMDTTDMAQFTRDPGTGAIVLSQAQLDVLTDVRRYEIPPEELQVAVLTFGNRPARWTHWELLRLARRIAKSNVPKDWKEVLIKRSHPKHLSYYQLMAEDTFYSSRTAGALISKFSDLKRLYGSCVTFNNVTSGGGDSNARYDRSLPPAALLSLLGERLEQARKSGLKLDKDLTAEAYMYWTYDKTNGMFAVLARFFHETPSAGRVEDFSNFTPMLPRSGGSAQGTSNTATFNIPRDPPAILEDDNDSSLGPSRPLQALHYSHSS